VEVQVLMSLNASCRLMNIDKLMTLLYNKAEFFCFPCRCVREVHESHSGTQATMSGPSQLRGLSGSTLSARI
jgi:hypothetical protein